MSKLKTLNDWKITYDNGRTFFECDDFKTNSGDKFVEKLINQAMKYKEYHQDKTHFDEGVLWFIGHFFNVSGDDLK